MTKTEWLKNLKIGEKYEEEVASFFESKGFNVWQLGRFQLPVDLFVWKGKKSFWVEVKFRSEKKYPVFMDETKLFNFMEIGTTVFLIVIHPNSTKIRIYKKVKWGEPWLYEEQLLVSGTRTVDYKEEVNWDEVPSRKRRSTM